MTTDTTTAAIDALMKGVTELHDFLRGTGPIGGCYFGDRPHMEAGRFWWRKYLPRIAAARDLVPALAARVAELESELATARADYQDASDLGDQLAHELATARADAIREAETVAHEWQKMVSTKPEQTACKAIRNSILALIDRAPETQPTPPADPVADAVMVPLAKLLDWAGICEDYADGCLGLLDAAAEIRTLAGGQP